MRIPVAINELCFMHEQLLKIEPRTDRVSTALAKLQDSILLTVEDLTQSVLVPTNKHMAEMVVFIKQTLDEMGIKAPEKEVS